MKYIKAKAEMVRFDNSDVITTSTCNTLAYRFWEGLFGSDDPDHCGQPDYGGYGGYPHN